MPDEALLELTEPRVLDLHDAGNLYTITCRRVLPADWLAYFDAIRITSEQGEDGKRATVRDFDTAAVLLAERVIDAAEGYDIGTGGGLADLPNWPTRLPLAHRMAIGRTLSAVAVSPRKAGAFVIRAEGEEVLLDAAWSRGASGMRFFTGLKHLLKTPSAAQYKRYNEASSRSVVVGGSRTGKTVFCGAQALLAKLYDELILSVEGYAVNGRQLGEPDITREMDMAHKVIAAQELFNPASTVSTQPPPDADTAE